MGLFISGWFSVLRVSDTEVRIDLAYLKGVVGCRIKAFLCEDLRGK